MSSRPTGAGAEKVLAVSPQFKKAALSSVLAIAGFIVVYFVLFALALGFTLLCLYGGVLVLLAGISWLTLVIGLGIMACGVLVFVFLIKFLFASSKTVDRQNVEITQAEQPELFASIYSLAEKIGTRKPKKVFLTPEVNAAVFYHSSFWSMFLPVRKNLKIGLGLVNTVNVSELEAVIAHEFGHFSQKSMKVGSWVYQVNRVIYDMLFNNQGFGRTLTKMSEISNILYFFALIASKIIQGIQWVLHLMYRVVNKSYMRLSRQMEFHADLVAAYFCGSNNIIHSLRRIELSSNSYDSAIGFCNKIWQEKKVATDFYFAHLQVLQNDGKNQKLAFENNLPLVSSEHTSTGNRVSFKDQWSSHPTTDEREEYLESFDLAGPVNHQSAWSLFRDVPKLKEELTKKLYLDVPHEEVKEVLDKQGLETLLKKELESTAFPPVFRGYYDNRELEIFDVDAVSAEPAGASSFDEIFSEETYSIPKKLASLREDIGVLQSIRNGQIDTRSFDFDGRKYKKNEAAGVLELLNIEVNSLEEKLKEADQKLFRYFIKMQDSSMAGNMTGAGEEKRLKEDYRMYFERRKEAEFYLKTVNEMMDLMAPVYRGDTIQIEDINHMIKRLKDIHEPAFKDLLKRWMEELSLSQELKEKADRFINANYFYFHETSFFDNELIELNDLVQEFWRLIYASVFAQFQKITEKQALILTYINSSPVLAWMKGENQRFTR